MAEPILKRLHGPAVEFMRYFLASLVALGVDYTCYRLLAAFTPLHLPVAAAIGYTLGLGVAYVLIAGRVFTDGWLREERTKEIVLFIASGIFGIGLTYVTVSLYVRLVGPQVNAAKLAAVAVSFIGVYLFRKLIVFRKAGGDAAGGGATAS